MPHAPVGRAPPRRPLRLLLVGTDGARGGAESYWIALGAALAAAGHEVTAVAAQGGVVWRGLEETGGVVLRPAVFQTKWDRAAVAAVDAAARAANPDWLLCNYKREYWGALFVGWRRGIPVALFRHHAELKPVVAYGPARLARRFVVPSEFLRRWVVARGAPAGRTVVLPNPFDVPRFAGCRARRAEVRAALGLAGDDVVVAYLGRLDANKGVHVLAEALGRAMEAEPRLRVLWAGDGVLRPALDAAVGRTPFAGRHRWLGWTDDPAGVYAAADVVVLPSLWEEAFGRVLVEAQAAGVPVIASRVGGTAETMRPGESGLLVPRGDAGALADAIVALAVDPERRARMGAAGRAFARATFDGPVVAAACARMLAESR